MIVLPKGNILMMIPSRFSPMLLNLFERNPFSQNSKSSIIIYYSQSIFTLIQTFYCDFDYQLFPPLFVISCPLLIPCNTYLISYNYQCFTSTHVTNHLMQLPISLVTFSFLQKCLSAHFSRPISPQFFHFFTTLLLFAFYSIPSIAKIGTVIYFFRFVFFRKTYSCAIYLNRHSSL